MKNIKSIRREYGTDTLSEENMFPDPFKQFELWFTQVLDADLLDATAMVIATVDEKGFPDSRVVLLKEFNQQGFVFYTHYNSPKATHAEKTGVVALNFHWREFARQIRIRGKIQRISRENSQAYFETRPRDSQIATLASHQSCVLDNREVLENEIKKIISQYEGKPIPCPVEWGGYCVMPFEFEFFQGRNHRLNDRIRYRRVNENWIMERLSP
jgi:pyridoxamine 5'-phosphate oxidase